MKKGYKYRGGIGILDKDGNSVFERDINTLAGNQIFLPTKKELNDPTEGLYNDDAILSLLAAEANIKYKELLKKFAQVGIYSLCNNVTNELLWAYYGGGHSGFAIEYDIERFKEALNHNQYFKLIHDFNVEYSESIPKADISILHRKDSTHILKTYLGTKSLSWKHEDEYRLIVEGIGLFDIDYRAITGIYFGLRMQENEMDYIMKKLKGRELSYYKMRPIENSYKVVPSKIEDKYANATKYVANCIGYDVDELLMHGALCEREIQLYRDKFVEALESIKYDPMIEAFYLATISMNSTEPLLTIFANTKIKTPPTREYNFKLNENGEIYRIK